MRNSQIAPMPRPRATSPWRPRRVALVVLALALLGATGCLDPHRYTVVQDGDRGVLVVDQSTGTVSACNRRGCYTVGSLPGPPRDESSLADEE